MNLATFSLAASLSLVANDNAVSVPCAACNAHNATRGDLCPGCDADMMAHYSEGAYSDPEAWANLDGYDTDPRF